MKTVGETRMLYCNSFRSITNPSTVRFCLLEQFLPEGPEHPFALKMIEHFEKLRTPLRCLVKYSKLQDQQRRFLRYEWSSVNVKSLWDCWLDPSIISITQRQALDQAEPFDEWEEFILFASHYFLLVASTSLQRDSTTKEELENRSIVDNHSR